MKELKGTKTEKNLMDAFAGESQAHTKYLYYASKAKKEGYVQISNLFIETALNEKEHAKLWFKYLHDGEVPTTTQNLEDAANGENYEFKEIAAKMRMVGAIERHHEERYRQLLKNINDEIVFSREGDVIWQCANCGHIVIGKKAPKICPVCNHPQSYFQIEARNY